ncbi:MAG: flagellar hook-basal body complex protein [Candidatus Eremiobacteraeota bacterium]|nr:flagellar hook-basal body complex protein [Candidatus Eremiobacteraeota bacterium]
MNRALYAAATGMAAQQQNLDVIADNLANADVAGFKSAQATFAAIGGDASLGTASAGVHRIFAQGKLMKTGGPFDVAIDGAGFFAVERDGRRAYTRAGSFSRAVDGTLRTPDGWTLRGVRIPANALDVTVAPNGRVTATLDARAGAPIGQIRLASFVAPERLRPLGSASFAETAESGVPRDLTSGGEHGPKIAFGMLEKSNVSTIESMMAILTAQRAYEANAKSVQAADEMLRIANNLHRS